MKAYSCPHCNGKLNVHGKLIFAIKTPRGQSGLVVLSDMLGDYDVSHHPALELNQGDLVSFHCPVCRHSLNYSGDDHLVRVFLEDEEDESTVFFSAVFGENATFQVSEKRSKTYGERLAKFKDPNWYLNFDNAED